MKFGELQIYFDFLKCYHKRFDVDDNIGND